MKFLCLDKTAYFIAIILTQVLLSLNGHAINDDIVEINSLSASGRTFTLNRGKYDNIRVGEYGVLIVKSYIDEKKSVYKPVAKLKLIKSFERDSVWIAYKVFLKSSISQGRKYILLTESQMLKGRTDLTIKRTSLVTNSDATLEVKDFLLEGDNLAVKKDDFIVIEKPHEKEKHFETDVDLIDVKKFEKTLGDEKLYVSGLYRSPHGKEFSKRKRVRTFEKMVVAYLNKYNDPSFRYEKFYEEQARGNSSEFTEKSLSNVYNKQYDEKLVTDRKRKQELYESLLNKGEAWSEEYTDNQLQGLLRDFSIVREQKRRETLASFKYTHQLSFSFGLNLIDNDNVNDIETTQETPYDFSFSYESEFMTDVDMLKYLTYEYSFRRSHDSFYGGTYNLESLEYSVASHLNWYPFIRSGTINRNIFFFGLTARFGYSSLSNNTTGDTGAYQVYSLPGVNVGIKYNFENSWGYKIMMSYQSIIVEKVVRAEDGDILPNEDNYIEGKMSAGITKFF